MDLHALWQEVRRPWLEMHQWPALAWLTPDAPVRVWHADGHATVWLGDQPQPQPPAPASAKAERIGFEALEIADDLLLRRQLTMPAMPEAQVAQAVALDVQSVSPFVPTDVVWAYRAQASVQGGLQVDSVFASRKQINQYIQSQASRLTLASAPEVWALTPAGLPMVLPGWGEARRARYGTVRRRAGYALLLSAAALVAAMAITPTAQLRLQAIEAVNSYTDTHQRTAALMVEREAFVRSNERLEVLRTMLAERADALKLIETLTNILPDDTSLQTLQVQGLKVTLHGLTANSATLLQLLSAQEGFKEVRAPSAAVRSPGATAEVFLVEFFLDPAIWSVVALPPAPSASAASVPSAAASAPSAP